MLTLEDLVTLVLDWNRPVKLFIETKHPVRYGALVESKVLALLHRYGIASPASADLSRAVVMSFSAAAVWRIRRAAPMLPTVLLGETSRYLGGSAAYEVDIGWHVLRIVIPLSGPLLQEGTPVAVTVDPQGCVLLDQASGTRLD